MIYTRLLQRLPAVVPPPERKYYTFDCLDGYLHSPCMSNETGLLWEPWNPNYDPGPPPELSEKRKEKEAALATLAQLPLAVAPDPRERRARPQAGPSSSQVNKSEAQSSGVPENTSAQRGKHRNRHWRGRRDRNLGQPRESYA